MVGTKTETTERQARYICIEGPEGVGKTTLLDRLVARYPKAFLRVRQPGSPTGLGKMIREAVMNTALDPWTERLLFLADNIHFQQSVLPKLMKNRRDLLQDRTNYISDLAYGRARGVPVTEIGKLHSLWPTGRKFDLLIVLGCSWNTCEARMRGRGNQDVIESRGREFLQNVWAWYAEHAEATAIQYANAVRAVNAEGDEDRVFERFLSIIQPFLGFPS